MGNAVTRSNMVKEGLTFRDWASRFNVSLKAMDKPELLDVFVPFLKGFELITFPLSIRQVFVKYNHNSWYNAGLHEVKDIFRGRTNITVDIHEPNRTRIGFEKAW